MNSNNELNELWSKQNIPGLPDVKTIYSDVTKLKKKRQLRLAAQNAALVITIIFLVFIAFFSPQILLSMKVGITCAVAASICFVFANHRIILLLKKATPELCNLEYLEQLVSIKKRQFLLQKMLTKFYFILLSIGICLCMIDYTNASPHATMIYALAFAWILYTYFFVRPKKIRKQQTEVDLIIGNLEKIEGQINSGE